HRLTLPGAHGAGCSTPRCCCTCSPSCARLTRPRPRATLTQPGCTPCNPRDHHPDRAPPKETIMTQSTATSVSDLERLKVLHNGEKQPLTFSDAEFERRLTGLRRIMAEKDLDAVLLTSYQGIKYYSDFLFTYFGRSYGMVVTADDTC